MIRDPRAAFDQLFGVGATPAQRAANRRTDRSILDWVTGEVARIAQGSRADDRRRLDQYLTTSARSSGASRRVEAYNASGEPRDLPGAPMGVPDSFSEHVKLMYDLQAMAFAADITRVFSFKLGRDGSARVYPESGAPLPFHPASHHGENEARVAQFAQINKYHVEPGAVLPRQAEEHPGRRRQPARQDAGHLRVADGQLEHAQPQALPAVPRRPRQRHAQGQPARQGARRHADGERRC